MVRIEKRIEDLGSDKQNEGPRQDSNYPQEVASVHEMFGHNGSFLMCTCSIRYVCLGVLGS